MNDELITSGTENPAFFGIFGLVYFAVIIFLIVAEWKIYVKAGKPGWACIVPIYNIIVLLEIVGKPWWWLLLLFIPLVNLVFAVWIMNLLSKSFGKSEGFTVGLIFLPFVFYPILGFGDAQYQGQAGDYYREDVLDA